MSASLHTSTVRGWIGLGLAAVALLLVLFVLPDAAQDLARMREASSRAGRDLQTRKDALRDLNALAQRLATSELKLSELEKKMPQKSIGQLQWELSRTLHDLSSENGIRLLSVKYNPPNRDAAKGTDLESLDVEFNALGVYQSLKGFMHALEGSGLPFAVGAVKLDESPEGARLSVVLRAFRKAGPARATEPSGEAA
jgi:hypothetical protein